MIFESKLFLWVSTEKNFKVLFEKQFDVMDEFQTNIRFPQSNNWVVSEARINDADAII